MEQNAKTTAPEIPYGEGGEKDGMSDAFAPPRKPTTTLLSSSPVLSGKVDLGMDDTHMPRQGIVARKGLFLHAQRTADLLLASVVDGVFVPGEVVWPREDGVTWLASGRIDAIALVRTSLAVASEQGRR